MNKKTLLTTVLIIVIAALGIIGYNTFLAEKPVEGEKNITITVQAEPHNYEKQYSHKTSADTLGEALDELGIIEGEDGQFGRYITSIDGIAVDEKQSQWWKIMINGADAQASADQTVLHDQDQFELVLMTGWDR